MATEIQFSLDFKPLICMKYKGKLKNDLYPYWYWNLKDKKGNEFKFYPTWEDLFKYIEMAFVHEKKLDKIMGRNSEFQKWHNFAKKICELQINNEDLDKYGI